MGGFRYAAFDLDGTLLDDRETLGPDTAAGLYRLREQGLQLYIVTGRTYERFTRLGFDEELMALFASPALLNEGDVAWHHRSRWVEPVRTVSVSIVDALLDAGMSHVVAESGGTHWAYSRFAATRFAMLYRVPRSGIATADGTHPEAITKLSVFHPIDDVRPVLRRLPCELGTFTTVEGCVVFPAGPCKAVALADRLARDHGEPDLAGVIAFGNDPNDGCLLAACGAGMAVRDSHPDAVARASHHLDRPIADFLRELEISVVPQRDPAGACPHAAGWRRP